MFYTEINGFYHLVDPTIIQRLRERANSEIELEAASTIERLLLLLGVMISDAPNETVQVVRQALAMEAMEIVTRWQSQRAS